MTQLWIPHTGIPGTGNEIHTTEQDYGGLIYGNIQGILLQPAGSIILGTSLDAGNTGFTNVLRQGLIMAQITATKKWTPFAEAGTNGSEIPRGVLLVSHAIPNSLDVVNPSIMVGNRICLEPGALCLASSAAYGLGTTGAGLIVRKAFANAFQFSDDFMGMTPDGVVLAAASGALATSSNTVIITKTGSLAALTLAAPTSGQNGSIMRIVSSTAFAHTVTATGLIDDGVTGGSKNLITFAAFPGASVTLIAYEGKWNTLALKATTVS